MPAGPNTSPVTSWNGGVSLHSTIVWPVWSCVTPMTVALTVVPLSGIRRPPAGDVPVLVLLGPIAVPNAVLPGPKTEAEAEADAGVPRFGSNFPSASGASHIFFHGFSSSSFLTLSITSGDALVEMGALVICAGEENSVLSVGELYSVGSLVRLSDGVFPGEATSVGEGTGYFVAGPALEELAGAGVVSCLFSGFHRPNGFFNRITEFRASDTCEDGSASSRLPSAVTTF